MSSRNRKYGPDHPWTKFKLECAAEIGHTQYCKENNDEYKGDLPSRVNGEQGGPIGGQMVKKMIAMAKQQQGIT
jgi:small acid-soluble spore protein D (minor alpha/beta-type SASP)